MTSVAKGTATTAFLLFGILVGFSPANAQQGPPEHPPILIEGDLDLCDDEDGDGEVAQDDGIVNCGEADGTPEKPYAIRGWSLVGSTESSDQVLMPRCDGAAYHALLNLCRLTRSVVVEDVTILNPMATYEERNPPPDLPTTRPAAGLYIVEVTNVVLDRLTIKAAGAGLVVEGSRSTSAASPFAVELRSSTLGPHLPEGAATGATGTARSVFEFLDSDVRVQESDVDATGRMTGAFVDATTDTSAGLSRSFVFIDSAIRNAVQDGLIVRETGVVLAGSVFEKNGLGYVDRLAGVSSQQGFGDVRLESVGVFEVSDNRFLLQGAYGIHGEFSDAGLIDRNRFVAEPTTSPRAVALFVEGDPCLARFHYNDLDGVRVVNTGNDCSLDARYNWWGSETGPVDEPSQYSTDVEVSPWLHLPLDDLPAIVVEDPAPLDQVFGLVTIRGTASSPPENSLLEVQVSTTNDWAAPSSAEGTTDWTYRWDASREGVGIHSLWFRGCGAAECGPVTRADFAVIPQPRPPVALLSATPDVAAAGQEIILNAGASYSPQGWQIAQYRFLVESLPISEWGETPQATLVLTEPGRYVASVEVLDERGLINANPGSVVIRVEDDAAGTRGSNGGGVLPGPAGWTFFVAIGLALVSMAKGGRGRWPGASEPR